MIRNSFKAIQSIILIKSDQGTRLGNLHNEVAPISYKDFLMIIFFLDIGLELKAAQEQGMLAHKRQWGLPAVAALGGTLIPSLIYLGINFQYPENYNGFAIPCATDIAFALCFLNLLGI
jgi:NhaA family Na+:H+ antiporter